MHSYHIAALTVRGRSLRRGKHRLLLWPDREADGSHETNTPSKVGTRDEMGRLEKVRVHDLVCITLAEAHVQLVKKYERGDLPKSDWLDALAFRKMAEIHAVRDALSVMQLHILRLFSRQKPRCRRTCTYISIYLVLISLLSSRKVYVCPSSQREFSLINQPCRKLLVLHLHLQPL